MMGEEFVRHIAGSFRQRLCEWELSIVLMLWGVALYHSDVAAIGRLFGTLFLQCPPDSLAGIAAGVGLARFLALLVNGLWRRTPFIRAAMAMVSLLFWSQISLGLVMSGVITPGWAVYPVFTILEFINVYFAMSDARVAHERFAEAADGRQ